MISLGSEHPLQAISAGSARFQSLVARPAFFRWRRGLLASAETSESGVRRLLESKVVRDQTGMR